MDSEGVYIYEGSFKGGLPDGFARIICPQEQEEEYYIGQMKMGAYNGRGKAVYKSGEVEEGKWAINEFIE